MGNKRSSRQDVSILTETDNVVDEKLWSEVGYVVSQDEPEAWALNNHQIAIDEETGRYFQTVCERSYKPLIVFGLDDGDGSDVIGKNVDTLFEQKFMEALALSLQHKVKDKRTVWLGVTVLTLALIIGLLATSMSGGISCSPDLMMP